MGREKKPSSITTMFENFTQSFKQMGLLIDASKHSIDVCEVVQQTKKKKNLAKFPLFITIRAGTFNFYLERFFFQFLQLHSCLDLKQLISSSLKSPLIRVSLQEIAHL